MFWGIVWLLLTVVAFVVWGVLNVCMGFFATGILEARTNAKTLALVAGLFLMLNVGWIMVIAWVVTNAVSVFNG